jgi:hypothetical protein
MVKQILLQGLVEDGPSGYEALLKTHKEQPERGVRSSPEASPRKYHTIRSLKVDRR